MTSILIAARLAHDVGLCVLPVREDGSKAPDVASWAPFQTTRPTIEQMRDFGFGSRAGFGVIAGAVSGYRECWDFDDLHTYQAFVDAATACGLGEIVSRIIAGFENETPNGGRRWIVTYPPEVESRDVTLARRPGREGEPKVKTLIELPTFAIVAPSNGATHPSGRAYRQLSGGFDTMASYAVDERNALIALARSFDELPKPAAHSPRSTPRPLADGNERPGDCYNRLASWPEILPDWTEVYTRGETIYLRRPGKDTGISATVNHGGSDLLYVFSSSTPFDPEKSYSKFAAHAVLHHGGDFSAAGKALARDGYGTRPEVHAEPRRPRREPSTPPPPATGLAWRWLGDVERERIDWLWPSRLARGVLTLFIGDGGLGKSRVSTDLAARVSTGREWPDGGALREPASSIVLSAEDSPGYTIRPAIEAAGGDVRRVAIIDAVLDETGTGRTFQLATDLAALDDLITTTGAMLVIIDPLSAYFGTRLDSYRDTDVRSVLEPVCKLAERRRVAILGIMHIGKGSDRSARHRALGSVAFVNTARLTFIIGADPDDPDRRLMVAEKNNLFRQAPALAFCLEDADGVARVAWEPAPVTGVTADTVLGRPAPDDERHDAEGLLQQLLADEAWPLPATMVAAAGSAHGIHVRSLQRAARRLGIQIKKADFRAGWLWHKPVAAEDDTAADVHSDSEGLPKTTGVVLGDVSAKTTPPPRRHEDVTVSDVSSSADLSSSATPKTTVSSSSSSSKQQQIDRRREDDKRMSTRAREGMSANVSDDPVLASLVKDLQEAFGAGTKVTIEDDEPDR